ncbi:MAG: TetR/AcrR family transcriptional regulator [Solidesulfovibrio sp.]
MARLKQTATDSAQIKTRIVDTAEGLFREVGYSKTTVADIAAALAMSSANIYRYFASKAAINEALCERIVQRIESRCEETLIGEASAADKLSRFILEYHRSVKHNILKDKRLHDMVAVAIEQHWSVINGHSLRMLEHMRRLVAQGIETGAFRAADPMTVATALNHAIAAFVYPALVEHCVLDAMTDGAEDTFEDCLRHLLALMLRGLRP